MALLRVDQNKCIQCGICAAVCPAGIIAVGEDGPKKTGFRTCIACGHCVAACPTEALDNKRAPLAGQVPLKDYPPLDRETAARYLRSRRSIRCYKPEPVPEEKLRQILDLARFASTGSNSQGISYLVISGREKLKQLAAATIAWMEQEVTNQSAGSNYYTGVIRTFHATGKDVILRDAPHLIVALSAKEFERGQENAQFTLAYAELFAPTLGVGTCWAGFFQRCAFSGYAPLLAGLNIPAGKTVAGALMAGYPEYAYYRLVDRQPLDVVWQ